MNQFSAKQGELTRSQIYKLLKQRSDWVTIKEIRQQLNLHSATSSHLDMMIRQRLIEEKIIYKIVGGRGRRIKHYKAVRFT